MIERAARSRSAVSSTTTGGLPGPATMVRLLAFMAAGHGGPASDTDQLDAAMLEHGVGRFNRWLGDHADQVVDAKIPIDGFVETSHAFGRHALAGRVRIDDQRVATRDHAHRIAGNRGQRVRDRSDDADDAERRMFDDREPMVAAKNFAPHELDTGRTLAERFELFDLVRQAADLGFFHFHRAQLNRLLDRNAANVIDDAFALFERPLAELLEGLGGGGHGFVDASEDAKSTRIPATIDRRRRSRGRAHLSQDLLDNRANEFFSGLHDDDDSCRQYWLCGGVFAAENARVVDVHGVDQPDDDCVDRQVLGLGREPVLEP